MVITEGWDIPRACMLYQMRDSQSKQLDEQVVGRVRRNPRLLDFEKLTTDAQELAMKAWVWGVKEKDKQKIYVASLFEEPSDITGKIRIRTTKLKTLSKKPGFDIKVFMDECSDDNRYSDIFSLYRKFKKAEPEVQSLAFEYADKPCKWMKFAENLDKVVKESNKYICDYSKSMELSKEESGKVKDVSFPVKSLYTDNVFYENISDWVWRRDTSSDKFAFDSDAEREWASRLKDLAKDDNNELTERVAQTAIVGKRNPIAGQLKFDGSVEPDKINPKKKYLWGKNYLSNSEIKFEYCLDGIHSSYPDFVMKDCYGRIHLFEVKSVNVSGSASSALDSEAYKQKINELIKCYKQASILTGHVFYLPVKKDDDWHITRLLNGKESTLTFDQFTDFMKTKPAVQSPVSSLIYIIPSSEIAPSQRYTTHLPVYPLRAACGYFDECGSLPEEEAEGWLDVSGQLRHLNKDMYIVHAEGRSMEPKIHDGDLCVFEKTAGSRQGKIVLVKAKDELDPNAGSYTIKQYSSESKADEDGRNIHTRIVLSPLNPEFQPIILEADKAEEGEFQVYGELVQVIL